MFTMLKFGLYAAQRSRYARAAYYFAVIKDIYTYKNEKVNLISITRKFLSKITEDRL